jgi:hypothetical protein
VALLYVHMENVGWNRVLTCIGLSILARVPGYAMSSPRAPTQAPHLGRRGFQDSVQLGVLVQGHGFEHGKLLLLLPLNYI